MSEKFSRLPMYLCVWCVAVVAACAPSTTTSSALSSIVSATPTPTPGASATPTGPTSAIPGPLTGPTKVSVTATFPTNVYAVLHAASDWTKSCTIDVNSSTASDKDLLCYLEVEETDLYSNTYTFTATSPVAACPYLSIAPFYYYHFSYGYGPTAVSYDSNSGKISNLVGGGGIVTVAGDGSSLQCIYDHSTDGYGDPNCCQGVYQATVTDTTSGDVTTSTLNWGGKVGNCAMGPRTTDSHFGRDQYTNIPLRQLVPLYAGGTFGFQVKAPITAPLGTNLTTANFVTDVTNIPLPLRSDTLDGHVYNEWLCLDGGGELLGRIRVLTREWTLASELAKGSLGVAHSTGDESNYPNDPPMPIAYPKLDWIDWVTFGTTGLSYPGTDIRP